MNNFYPFDGPEIPLRQNLKRFLPSSSLVILWAIILFFVTLVMAIALKGLLNPDLLNPEIINPDRPEQILTPSPLPAPQLIITPTIPQAPAKINNSVQQAPHSFPIWVFAGILGGSALVSLLVTAWLRFLSLPMAKRRSINSGINQFLSILWKIIILIITLIPNLILALGKGIIKFLQNIDYSSEEVIYQSPKPKTIPKGKKIPSKTSPKNETLTTESNLNYGPPVELQGYILTYKNDEIATNNLPPNQKVKPKKSQNKNQSQPNFPQTKKIKKKPVSPTVKNQNMTPPSIETPPEYQPQITILAPEESSPLDQRQPTLAQLMDLRHRRSLSSLLDEY